MNQIRLLASNTHPMWVHDARTLQFLDVNDAATELYGYTRHEFLEMTLTDLAAEESFGASYRYPPRGLDLQPASVHRRKDGSTLRVELLSTGVKLDQGLACLTLCRKSDPERRDRLPVEAPESLLRAAMDDVQDGILITDLSGDVIDLNARFEQLTGLSRSMVLGTSASLFPFIAGEWQALVDRAEGHIQRVHGEYEILMERADGSRFWVRVAVRPLHGSGSGMSGLLFSIIDIQQSRQIQDELLKLEQRYCSLFDDNPEAVYSADLDGKLLSVNPACEQLCGYPASDILETGLIAFVVEEDRRRVLGHVRDACRGVPQCYEASIIRHDGQQVDLSVSNLPIKIGHQVVGIYGIARDITESKKSAELVRRQAFHDSLTGLPNRALFNDRLTVELARAARIHTYVAVLFLDLDDFKLINDSLGHVGGDQILIEVAQRLKSCLRECDTVARMGGDDFTILAPDLKDRSDAVRVAFRVLEAIQKPFFYNGREVYASTSIGISLYPSHGSDGAALLQNADTALYGAKECSPGSYAVFEPSMNNRALERVMIEGFLRKALDGHELSVCYQPQFSVTGRALVGMEALIRWHCPDLGNVSPVRFIPIAEETGLIVPIGEWVLETACRQARQWQEMGYPPIRLAVNLSVRQFREPHFVSMVTRVLKVTGFPAAQLELEMTENMVMQYVDDTIIKLRQLRDLGIHISLDDFGTGYSSLSYLKRFNISALKIDQCFIRDIGANPDATPNDAAIVRAIVALAHSLNLRVIAEGVEEEDQAAFLESLDCDEIQGFLTGRPMLPADFESLLANTHPGTAAPVDLLVIPRIQQDLFQN